MVKFDGCLTGDAQKFFEKKMLDRGSALLIVLLLFSLPIWGFLSYCVGSFTEVMTLLIAIILLSPILFRFCVSKKARKKHLLKEVIINDEIITTICEKEITSNNISDVKEVQDHGEFYYIVLPCRYISTICVCQKEFLSTGTIEIFESIFKNKIVQR